MFVLDAFLFLFLFYLIGGLSYRGVKYMKTVGQAIAIDFKK